MIIRLPLRQLLRPVQLRGLSLILVLMVSAVTAQAGERRILVLGDSISAAYGMDLEQGWVALLEQRLAQQGLEWTTVNASISGDTTQGGLQRLPGLLKTHNPSVVMIELGGNDGLRGYPIKQLRDNLRAMTEQAQREGADVLLLTMEIPPNLGRRYTTLFRESFAAVAESTGAKASAFLLENIATQPALMQADGIHPTDQAQTMIVDNVLPALLPLLERRGSIHR